MRFVAVKSEEQQASTAVFRARDLLVRQRTQTIDALRGHLAEYGHVVAQGPAHVARLLARVEDPGSNLTKAACLAIALGFFFFYNVAHADGYFVYRLFGRGYTLQRVCCAFAASSDTCSTSFPCTTSSGC